MNSHTRWILLNTSRDFKVSEKSMPILLTSAYKIPLTRTFYLFKMFSVAEILFEDSRIISLSLQWP